MGNSTADTEAAAEEEVHILGLIGHLDVVHATVIFIGALILLNIIELLAHRIHEWSAKHRYKEVVNKLLQQLLVLGLISFCIFFAESVIAGSSVLSLGLPAFRFTELILLFIALALVIQACQLLRFEYRAATLTVRTLRMSAQDLLTALDKYTSSNQTWSSYLLFDAPQLFQVFNVTPRVRRSLDLKLIQALFFRNHDISYKFDYAKYMHFAFKAYINKLSRVNTACWCSLIVLILLNLLRLKVVDPAVNFESMCVDSENFSCEDYYIIAYACIAASVLCTLTTFVYVMSSVYYDRLVIKALQVKGQEGGRRGFRAILEDLVEAEEEEMYNQLQTSNTVNLYDGLGVVETTSGDVSVGRATNTAQNRGGASIARTVTLGAAPRSLSVPTPGGSSGALSPRSASNGIGFKKSKSFSMYTARTMDATHILQDIELEELYKSATNVHAQRQHKHAIKRHTFRSRIKAFFGFDVLGSGTSRFSKVTEHLREVKQKEKSALVDDSLFWFHSAALFFVAIDFCLFLQCVYTSFWATQLLPLLTSASALQGLWVVVLTIPIFLNYRLMRFIMTNAVVINSIRKIDKLVVLDVLQENAAATQASTELRMRLREQLIVQKVDPIRWMTYIKGFYAKCSVAISKQKKIFEPLKVDVALDRGEFRTFLQSLDIILDRFSFNALWNSIDLDVSGTISWDEMYLVAFPSLKQHLKAQLQIGQKIRDAVTEAVDDIRQQEPRTTKMSFLLNCYEFFDPDRRAGFITKDNAKLIITNLGVVLSETEFEEIFSSVGVNFDDDRVTWKQFMGITDPSNSEIDKMKRKTALAVFSRQREDADDNLSEYDYNDDQAEFV